MQFPAAFGKYELLERIATGGMAEVYLARSFGVAGFEKRLVIKRIRPEFASDPRFVSLFINEAKIAVHLSHPNIVQVYDLGKVGSSWFMAMEHLRGHDLTRLVKTLRAAELALPQHVAVAIVAKAARGLAYAHSRTDPSGALLGLVHRDVSPHNIMVTFDGEVKLVDFGVARLMNSAESDAEQPGRPGGGKYAYMSPEQAAGEPVDHRSDIFSAGIVLWELIVGHRLFQSSDKDEKLRLVREAIVPHPRDQGVEIDRGLWAILQRALSVEVDDRYDSAALFEEDLRAWLFHQGVRAGRNEIAQQMQLAFPQEAEHPGDDLDLARMVADLDRLDAPEPTLASQAGRATPAEGTALLGRLQQPDGERKPVAVLVIDVDGMTELSARVDADVLFKRHYQLLRWLRHITDNYGGVVHSAVDDHIVVFFGVPKNRDDDLRRALEAALELQRSVGQIRAKGLNISLAIGVHTGDVTLSARKRRLRYTARGNTTRMARRLSSVADHDEVLVSEAVLQAAENDYRLRRGPDVPNRGGKAPTPSYLLLEPRKGLRVAGKGPWLRRGQELDVIRHALIGLGQGTGAAIVLTGGPGSGKSRLLREIRDRAQRRGIPFYLARCTPFGEDPPMEPFRDLVRGVVGVEVDTPKDEVRQQLGRLTQLGLSERDTGALGALLGIGGVSRRAAAWAALRSVVRGLPREGPVIVALEDVQHLPRAETAELAWLLRAHEELPVLFLFTARGDAPDSVAQAARVVPLGRFDHDAQERLLRHLLDVVEVDERLVSLIDRTCEGNPLYLEQMAKYLLQTGRVTTHQGRAALAGDDDAPMPKSLAALISARIDALDPASKGALQLAAIIGLTFSAAVLGEAAGVDDPTPLVSDLVSHGLIVRTEGLGDDWAFSSELVQEAALRGILGVQRRDYHRMVAAAIETLHEGETEAWAEGLAHHCAEGGRHVDAARYALTAARRLEAEAVLDRSRQMLERGIGWIRKVPEDRHTWDARVQGEATLHLRHGMVCQLLGDPGAAERSLHMAIDISSDCGLPWIEAGAHLELGRAYMHRGRLIMAAAHVDQAREILTHERDPELELESLEVAAAVAYEQGQYEQADELWHDALALAQGNAQAEARCMLGLANRYLRTGDNGSAEPLLQGALSAARRASDRILEGRVLNNIGLGHSAAGEHDEAITWFRKALEVRQGIGYTRGVSINHHNIGDAWFHKGDPARAWVAFETSRELALEMGWDRGVVLNDVYMGTIAAMQGDEAGLHTIEQAIDAARTLGDHEIVSTGLWLSGKWMLDEGRQAEGRQRLEAALAEARTYDFGVMVEAIEELLGSAPGD